MNFQKHRDEILKEMDKVKFEQEEIEKNCLKLCDLKDNVIILFYIVYCNIYTYNIMYIIYISNENNLIINYRNYTIRILYNFFHI